MLFDALQRAGKYLRRTPLHPQWLLGGNAKIGRWIANHAQGRTLDVGCANRWIEEWLPIGSEYIGLDSLDTGRNLYKACPDLFADATKLPILDNCIDTVVILEVVEHLRYPLNAFHEISRVLQPGGRVLLSIPFLYPIHDAPHDFQRLTAHGLERDMQLAGLRVEELKPSIGSAETASLICCIAMAGMCAEALRNRKPGLLLIPFVLIAIPAFNLLARLLGLLLPSWDAVTAGYRLVASKP